MHPWKRIHKDGETGPDKNNNKTNSTHTHKKILQLATSVPGAHGSQNLRLTNPASATRQRAADHGDWPRRAHLTCGPDPQPGAISAVRAEASGLYIWPWPRSEEWWLLPVRRVLLYFGSEYGERLTKPWSRGGVFDSIRVLEFAETRFLSRQEFFFVLSSSSIWSDFWFGIISSG